MGNLTNIEKFHGLKKLNKLKAEYHKESLLETFRIFNRSAASITKFETIFGSIKKGIMIFKLFRKK